MKKNIFIVLLVSLLFISIVSASNPQHHNNLGERSCAESNPTQIQQIACNNLDAFVTCNIFTDFTVPKYFTEFVKYSNSHSPSLCQSLIQLAGTDEKKLSCAYGVCAHQIQDSASHNILVPEVIEKTKLTNSIIHALTEEAVNDILLKQDPQLKDRLKNRLRGVDGNAYLEYVDFFKSGLQQNANFQDENIEANIDFLVTQVIGKEQRYEHGFGTAFVVPIEIWLLSGGVLIISAFALMLLLFRREKKWYNWATMVALLVPIIIILVAFYGLFSGNLFTMYQSVSSPITSILPLGDYESNIDLQVQSTIQFFNQGSSYMSQVSEPTGITALDRASESGVIYRWVIGLVFIAILIAMVYFNFFFKKKR